MLDPNSRTQTTEYKYMYSSVVVCSYALNCCMALCKIAPFTPNSHLLRYNNQTMDTESEGLGKISGEKVNETESTYKEYVATQ